MSFAGLGVLWDGGEEAVDKRAKNSHRGAKFIFQTFGYFRKDGDIIT